MSFLRALSTACLLGCMATAVCANDQLAAGETVVTGSDITLLLSGRTAIGEWNGDSYRQFFTPDGTTYYAPKGKRSARGKWRVAADGLAYESWWNGSADNWEAYRIVRSVEGLAWLDPEGNRYPFDVVDGQQLVWPD